MVPALAEHVSAEQDFHLIFQVRIGGYLDIKENITFSYY